jgi:hypothetical protein
MWFVGSRMLELHLSAPGLMPYEALTSPVGPWLLRAPTLIHWEANQVPPARARRWPGWGCSRATTTSRPARRGPLSKSRRQCALPGRRRILGPLGSPVRRQRPAAGVQGSAAGFSGHPLSCLHYSSCSSTPAAFQLNRSGHTVLALDRAP